MKRRSFIAAVAVFPLLAIAGELTPAQDALSNCPICGGQLVSAGSVEFDRSLPSPNLDVWDGSWHDMPGLGHNGSSPYCLRCHLAYNVTFDVWERTSADPSSFFVELLPAVAAFPWEKAKVKGRRPFYSQKFKGRAGNRGRIESISFFARNSEMLLADLQAYANANSLRMEFREASRKSQIYIAVTTTGMPFHATR